MEKEKLLKTVRIEDPRIVNLLDDDYTPPTITLEKLYKMHYWITEVFGTDAYVVFRCGKHFNLSICRIFFNGLDEPCEKFIRSFAAQKYRYWKKYLLGTKNYSGSGFRKLSDKPVSDSF